MSWGFESTRPRRKSRTRNRVRDFLFVASPFFDPNVAEPASAWVRQNAWLRWNASRVYAANGPEDEARHLLGRALALAPRPPRLLFDLASLHVITPIRGDSRYLGLLRRLRLLD